MGLTIHWQWKTDYSREQARELTNKLYEYAATLGFQHCFEPVEIDWSRPPADSDEAFLRMRSHWTTHHEIETGDGTPTSAGDLLEPAWSICFFATDPGAEPVFIGFGEYPETWKFRDEILPSGATGLSWMNWCKTQYASMPQEGGEPNFMAAHMRIVKLLDEVVRLGIPVEVIDEGEYWETRDEDQLLAKLRQYNGLIAAFTGHLKDRLGDEAVQAPIRDHPEFERLEAAGHAEFGAKFEQGREAVEGMLERSEDEPPAATG
ncbi:MAG: hypothetical protein KDB82_13480 [Planctomycetes bacterium]|nr:hypothetical protein [Planctomycetota bacterium]